MRLHWYPWDPAAFAMSTMRWNYEEKGYYRDALDLSWTQDGLEDVGWLPERVQRKFEQFPDGRWRNARQERDRAEQVEKHQRRSSAGSKGGRPKSNALALDNQCLSNDKALPNQSLSIGKAMAKQNESNQNQNQIIPTELHPSGVASVRDEPMERRPLPELVAEAAKVNGMSPVAQAKFCGFYMEITNGGLPRWRTIRGFDLAARMREWMDRDVSPPGKGGEGPRTGQIQGPAASPGRSHLSPELAKQVWGD